MSNGNDQLDSLIDRALDSYTSRASRPGLEQRVLFSLASVTAGSRSHPRLWNRRLVWTFAVAAMLVIAVAVQVGLRHDHSEVAVIQHSSIDQARPPAPAVLVPEKPGTESALEPSRKPLRNLTQNPRRPTQQQLITQLLANAPEAVASLARLAEEQEKPIDIQPIAAGQLVIEPIKINPIDDNPADSGGAL
jgi:hypothetical protein